MKKIQKFNKSEKMARTYNSLTNVIGEFEAAAKHIALDDDQIEFIRNPRYSIKLMLPVKLDNNKTKVFKAYHVVHSNMRGPSIGGLQIRPNICFDTVEALAFWSNHQCALLGIPFGGSYGAIECNPTLYSESELEGLVRRYVAELSMLINANNDLMTSDIGTNQQTMCWLMDTFCNHVEKFIPAVALGKPIGLCGIKYNNHPVAIGVMICIRKACEHIGIKLKKAKVSIQGFGKAGRNIAELLYKEGAKIIAISDLSGVYYNEKGINIDDAVDHHHALKTLKGLESKIKVKKINNGLDIYKIPVDITIPAAVELQITKENIKDIKTKIIAEVANGPISPIADKILYERGVFVIPDILCNSGGISGHYFEWVQNRTGYYWTAEALGKEISDIVEKSFDDSIKKMNKYSIPLRLAASALAIKRISTVAGLRGMYA